ncbi:MAG: cobalamin-binding protein [Bryobacteraceae bacterium]
MRVLIALLLCSAALSAQPRRIVSTSPSITETLFALGLGSRVAGVSTHCHYPPEVKSIPKVGGYVKPNVETILSLRPDLVIVQRAAHDLANQLARFNIRVAEVEPENLTEALQSIRAIGKAAGVETRAEQLVADIRARLDSLRLRTEKLPRRSLLFIVGRTPGRLDGIVAVGSGSYLNELIRIAGGRNALADALPAYPRISLETIIRLNPDVILDMGSMADTAVVTEEHKQSVLAMWKSQPMLKAVAGGRLFPVASDIYVVPGPRMIDAAVSFAQMLHPEEQW